MGEKDTGGTLKDEARRFRAIRRLPAVLLYPCLLLPLLAGCQSPSRAPMQVWAGPRAVVMPAVEPWQYEQQQGHTVKTARYSIHTTVEDGDLRADLGRVMEGAYEQYRLVAPSAPGSNRPMQCYVFGKRSEWAQFTVRRTGADAAIYLQITRGGYTVHDWFVAYDLGDGQTLSVAAHEGWHQFCARHFRGRLPPFLEEGLACMFETVRMEGELPRWNLGRNVNRGRGLRYAVEGGYLWPLEKLVTMHAGEVVNEPGERIEAFYAQNWAFARFLWEGDGGRHRPALLRLVHDTANGIVYDPTNTLRVASSSWAPEGAKPILEHYLGRDLASIEDEYRAFVHAVARAEAQADDRLFGG